MSTPTTDPIASTKRALSVRETAEAASIGRTKVFEEIASGRLKARKFGRRTLILANDLNRWLDSLPAARP